MVPLSWAALGGSNARGRSFKERKRSGAGGARKALVRIVCGQINAVGPQQAGFDKNAEIGRIIFKNFKMFFYFYFCIWFSVFPQQMVPRIIVCGSFFSALRPLAPTLLHTHNLSTHTHSIVTYILSAHSLVTNTQHCQEYQLTSEYKERDDSNSGLTAGAPSAKGWRMQLAKTAIADSQEQFFVHCFFASCFISQAQLWQRTPKWQLRLAQFMYVRYTFPAWMSAGGFHPFRWSVQGGVRDPQLVGLILFVFVWNWGTPSLSDTSSFVHLK